MDTHHKHIIGDCARSVTADTREDRIRRMVGLTSRPRTEMAMLGPTSLTEGPFVTVDIETTGCRPGTSSVIEIGAARIENGAVTAHFSMLVCPTDSIPTAVVHLTGITQEMTVGAPPIEEVMVAFRDFARDAVLIAHNHRFDLSFLDYEAERVWGTPFSRPVLDTLCLARRLHPDVPRHNLRDLAIMYATQTVPNHRALPDALATAEIFLAMLPGLEREGITTAAEVARLCGVAQQSRLARKLSLATHLPDGPGVYLFRDAAGAVIFLGRAKSLRTRVRNHFYAADDTTCPSPASEVASIDHFPLVSGLDAALLEVRLHDRYAPTFNRNNHQQRQPLYLHMDTDAAFPALRPTRRRLRSGVLIGPLGNAWAAETLAETMSEYFGLRRCRRSEAHCVASACDLRERHLCSASEAYAAGPEQYATAVTSALAVFNGQGAQFRERLRVMQERSAHAERFEDAARYRDAARALDRTLSALAVASRAREDGVSAIIEGDEAQVVVIVLIRGWLFTTVRFDRAEVSEGAVRDRLARTLERAWRRARRDDRITPRQLRDMAIVDSYRQQHTPVVIPVTRDTSRSADLIASAIRRAMRVPRKRHVVASAD